MRRIFLTWLFSIMVNIRRFIFKLLLYLQHYVKQLRLMREGKKIRSGGTKPPYRSTTLKTLDTIENAKRKNPIASPYSNIPQPLRQILERNL